MPFEFAVPTPIIFRESFKTSPIITLIFDVPISRLTSISLLFKERHLLIQKHLIYCLFIKSDGFFSFILLKPIISYFKGISKKRKYILGNSIKKSLILLFSRFYSGNYLFFIFVAGFFFLRVILLRSGEFLKIGTGTNMYNPFAFLIQL